MFCLILDSPYRSLSKNKQHFEVWSSVFFYLLNFASNEINVFNLFWAFVESLHAEADIFPLDRAQVLFGRRCIT